METIAGRCFVFVVGFLVGAFTLAIGSDIKNGRIQWKDEYKLDVKTEGETAGRSGLPIESCPYSSHTDERRELWIRSWQVGFLELHRKEK